MAPHPSTSNRRGDAPTPQSGPLGAHCGRKSDRRTAPPSHTRAEGGRGAYLSGQLDPVHFRHLYVGYLPRSIRRLIHTKTTFRLVADGDGREELELLRTLRTTSLSSTSRTAIRPLSYDFYGGNVVSEQLTVHRSRLTARRIIRCGPSPWPARTRS